jgi:hypothetical protein
MRGYPLDASTCLDSLQVPGGCRTRGPAFVLLLLLQGGSALADTRQDCAKLMGDAAIAACSAAIRDDPRAAYAAVLSPTTARPSS